MGKEQEYKEIFLAEAHESYEQLNNLFTELEKDTKSRKVIDAIFRITHTLKGNAMGMGFTEIAELGHVVEDVFNEVKGGKLELDGNIFSSLFKANDVLGELIDAISNPHVVRYKGIKTKLEVLLKNNREGFTSPIDITDSTFSSIAHVNPEDLSVDGTASSGIINLDSGQQETAFTDDEDVFQSQAKVTISDVVQVPVRKLDALLNIVGELIIEKDSLIARYTDLGFKASEFARLHRITSDLQFGVMDVRLVQVGFMFSKFNRIVRDVAVIENKKVNLFLEGTEIEIDRNILKTMSDSLVHMVRNSVSHGIESPEERRSLGKPETGKIMLTARNEKDTVFIEVSDDGAGMDEDTIRKKAVEKGLVTSEHARLLSRDEVLRLIFEPGFSNAEKVTEISGRGVGMDVVKRATESIGGKIAIETEVGKGSTFILSLPSSMAVKGALLFELNKQEYAIPLTHTEAVISLRKRDLHKISNGLIATYLGHAISVLFLHDLFNRNGLRDTKEGPFHPVFEDMDDNQKLELVVVSYSNKLVGLIVDRFLQQREIVEKTLFSPVDENDLFSGATILGNGNVCLVLNVVNVLNNLFKEKTANKI